MTWLQFIFSCEGMQKACRFLPAEICRRRQFFRKTASNNRAGTRQTGCLLDRNNTRFNIQLHCRESYRLASSHASRKGKAKKTAPPAMRDGAALTVTA